MWVVILLAGGCEPEEDPQPDPDGEPPSMELDDEFDGDLSAWEVLNPADAATLIDGGKLHVEPAANSLWFNARAGALVHQAIEGDFVGTTFASARRLSEPGLPPQPQYRLGGLMARASGTAENYVFIVVGADGDDVSVETKTTQNGSSTFMGPPFPSGAGQLRICRLGPTFRLLARESETAAWQEFASYDRPDLPSVLQVGPMAYANTPDPDLRVSFDYVRFANPDGPEACTR
jgi:hypothetical protein